MAKLVKTNQGLYKRSSAVGPDALPNSSSQFQHEYDHCCKNNTMWPSKVKQWGQKHENTQVSGSLMLLACLKLNYGGQINSWGQRFARWGHIDWKTVIEFDSCCHLFIFSVPTHLKRHVCLQKRDRALLGAQGLVLVNDNNVPYLLGYAPVSSFCDPPSSLPPTFKMSSWMVKNLLLHPSIKDLAINNALWSWGVIKQDD